MSGVCRGGGGSGGVCRGGDGSGGVCRGDGNGCRDGVGGVDGV